jgi:hypothetical protein
VAFRVENLTHNYRTDYDRPASVLTSKVFFAHTSSYKSAARARNSLDEVTSSCLCK